jgi:trans-aconitate methyltransferase
VHEATGDRWSVGGAYDAYMGRWSSLVARQFLDWLDAGPAGHWLEVGCGTGALTSSICAVCEPASIVASDQSASFVEHARTKLQDSRISYVAAAVDALPSRTGGFDAIVSGLVLNFLPEPSAALTAMHERLRRGGIVGAYLWDYSGGVELLHHFWEAAVAADAGAAALDESRRFATWERSYLTSLLEAAGLIGITAATLTVPTTFATFDDYWTPFLGGTGPAPSYVASLSAPQRELLAQRLRERLAPSDDGSIRLQARALAVRGIRP